MFHHSGLRSLFILITSLALGASVLHAAPAAIEDNGAFFTEQTKAEVAREIEELKANVKKDIAIETFQEIPGDIKNGVDMEDKAAVNRLFDQWATRQAKTKGVNGVYLLLVKSPAHLRIVVGNDTQKRAFTLQDRDRLIGKMLVKLRAKDFDGALLEGVNFISVTMRANAGGNSQAGIAPSTEAPAKSGGSSFSILTLLLIGLAVWVVIGVIRALFGNRNAGGMGTPAMTGGGGGFFSSLMGGMFGAAAGMWMYNQFFDNHASASDQHHDSHGAGNDQSLSGQDTDYTSSGDSFTDNSGDSGGGDFGGGDSGGGD